MAENNKNDTKEWAGLICTIVMAFTGYLGMKNQEKQHLDAMGLSQTQYVKSQNLAQSQFSDSQAQSQKQFIETIQATFEDLRLSHDPYLQFEREGIVFIERSAANRWQRTGLSSRMFDPNDQNSLPELENLGRGPAFQVEFDWIITAINGKNTEAVSHVSMPSERNLRGDEENIRVDWIPVQILSDASEKVKSIDGKVRLRCRSLSGRVLAYSMDMKITTHYRETRPYVFFTFTGWECDSCKTDPREEGGGNFGPVNSQPRIPAPAPEPPPVI